MGCKKKKVNIYTQEVQWISCIINSKRSTTPKGQRQFWDSVGEGDIPPHPSWVLLAGLIIKLPQDRLTGGKKINWICMHRGLIEIGPQKSPKQIVWVSFLENYYK